MGDANPIRTLEYYSKPSHEGYKNTIELPLGNNMAPLRSDTIRLVKNGCSFHGLQSEDPNQHLKDFLKLVHSLDLRDQASNWLEHLPVGSITTWKDLTTRFLAQFFHREGLCNEPRDFAALVKAISLPQDVPSTSDGRLIELENQVQRLMEAHLAPKQPTQVNKVTSMKAKIAVGERITRSGFGVKGVNLGDEESPYWTMIGKKESYKPRPSSDGVGAQTPYYARKDFLDCHLLGEWKISRDDEINPFKDVLVFRRMVEFLGAIPINLKSNMWESEDLIENPINWDKPPKDGDGAWHAKIWIIDPEGAERILKTLQSFPPT
ncbi:MAK10-like protein [Tanacetum coccineum]